MQVNPGPSYPIGTVGIVPGAYEPTGAYESQKMKFKIGMHPNITKTKSKI